MKLVTILSIIFISVFAQFLHALETIHFPSKDNLMITADLYMPYPNNAPFILLFHQAGFSRGEYQEIAPKLNQLGFNCLAIDQRAGLLVNGIKNETFINAVKSGKSSGYLDALQDMEAALLFVKNKYAKNKLIVWGSSYSGALVIKIANENKDIIDGIVAFSPGEYFKESISCKSCIGESAKKIDKPIFISSAKSEKNKWFSIYNSIPSKDKQYFLPVNFSGFHGSSSLWESKKGNQEYWEALKGFLELFID